MFSYVAIYLAVHCTVKICDVPNVSHVTHDKSMRDHVSFFEETNRIHQMVWHRPPLGALKLESYDVRPPPPMTTTPPLPPSWALSGEEATTPLPPPSTFDCDEPPPW